MTNRDLPAPLSPDAREIFHFDDGKTSFEDLAKQNGRMWWSARQLMRVLGYESWETFTKVINKAIATCATIGVPMFENFEEIPTDPKSGAERDIKLSKFACYLVAMQGDPKKPAVASAQAYFATLAQSVQRYIRGASDVERVDLRAQLSIEERSLSGTAAAHGVENYALFRDAGYRGMYNMTLGQLRQRKGDPSGGARPLLDFMDSRELAANQFRISETRARIEGNNIQGQHRLEDAAFQTGQSIRRIMREHDGTRPEDLPLAPDIKRIHSDLKKTQKQLGAPKKRKRN